MEMKTKVNDVKTQETTNNLEAVAATFPAKDAAPRYDPMPPQPWDRKMGGQRSKKRRKEAKGKRTRKRER